MNRSHPRRALALAAALLCCVTTATASDAHAGHAAPAKAAASAAAAPASAAAAAPAPAAPPAAAAAPVDPLVRVQQRLASRFGAQPASEHGAQPGSAVVRVVSKTVVPPAAHAGDVVLAAPAPKPAARPRPAVDPHAAAAAPHAGHDLHWAYDGEGGPQAWGAMKPEFNACSTGKRQSPIDIRDGVKLGLEPVQFDYKPSSFRVVDNGHTIQVDVGAGNAIEVLGQRYELVQFHFHRPSEEAIDGRRFDMVAHFVHKSLEGRLAVVAVLMERGGTAQAQLQQVWNHLPLEKGDAVNARATLDLARLLPEQRGYFTYMGSLTTPPCSEGVLWMVMKQPVPVTPEQIGVFARLYPMNARPIQSAAGRLIKESN